jgi:hypothetical protein
LAKLLEQYPLNTPVQASAVAKVINESLVHLLGAKKAKWSAAVKDGAPNVHIDYDARAILVPAGRSYSVDHIQALVVHEIGVHVVRSVKGEKSHERLSSVGMAGYGPTEEALGVLLASSVGNSPSRLHSLAPLAIIDFATAKGSQTFREVYNLTSALLLCINNPTQDHLEYKQPQYDRSAYSRTVRLLRLGTGQVVDRSPTKYWSGMLKLNSYLADKEVNKAELKRLLVGKYDCNNTEQRSLLGV